jgi:serine/threonine protein kinase
VRLQASRAGEVKGKIAYMAPEQLEHGEVDRRGDIYAASVVLWETLTGRRLFQGDSLGALIGQALFREIPRPSSHAPDVSERLDRLVLRGLAHSPEGRFATAREMAEAPRAGRAPRFSPRDRGRGAASRR